MTNMDADGSGRGFFRRHWLAFAIIGVAAALAFAGAVYVFVWFAGTAVSSGLVPSTLGLWTMGNLFAFVIYLAFWELLLVGIPIVVAVIAGWFWWKRLPDEERRGLHFGGRKSQGASGGLGFFFFLAFVFKVWLDGKWNAPIGSYTLDYVVGSVITILIWGLVIIGIPAAIGLTWWLTRGRKRTSPFASSSTS